MQGRRRGAFRHRPHEVGVGLRLEQREDLVVRVDLRLYRRDQRGASPRPGVRLGTPSDEGLQHLSVAAMAHLDDAAIGVGALLQQEEEELLVLRGAEGLEVGAGHEVLQVGVAAVQGRQLRAVCVYAALLLGDRQVGRDTRVQEGLHGAGVAPLQRQAQGRHGRLGGRLLREGQGPLLELRREVDQLLDLLLVLRSDRLVQLDGQPPVVRLLGGASLARAAVHAAGPQAGRGAPHGPPRRPPPVREEEGGAPG
mmetsp:Transcript_21748/g.64830  ORF Transcript_21748/g.64830 Transcript_21748/m.64830 type:complete len:253 (-) Transcript_21748:63-821(-)